LHGLPIQTALASFDDISSGESSESRSCNLAALASVIGNPRGGQDILWLQGYLDRLHEVEPQVCSFLALNEQVAMEQASAVDKSIAAGERLGPLAGVPLAIKVVAPLLHPNDVLLNNR